MVLFLVLHTIFDFVVEVLFDHGREGNDAEVIPNLHGLATVGDVGGDWEVSISKRILYSILCFDSIEQVMEVAADVVSDRELLCRGEVHVSLRFLARVCNP